MSDERCRRFWIFLLLFFGAMVFVGCDAVGGNNNALTVTTHNATKEPFRIKDATRGNEVFSSLPAGEAESATFESCPWQGPRDECEITLLAKPASSPPSGCGGWKSITRTFRVPRRGETFRDFELREARVHDPYASECNYK